MKRSFQPRTYKIVYRIYSILFLTLGIYTLGFFLFTIFDHAGHLQWSDYWDVAKFILLSMAILLVASIIAKATKNQSR